MTLALGHRLAHFPRDGPIDGVVGPTVKYSCPLNGAASRQLISKPRIHVN